MRFEVTGTEGQFGRDVLRIYEAPSEEAARAIAAHEGITVTGVDLLLDMGGFGSPPPPPSNPPPPPPPPLRPWRVEGAERLEGRPVVRQYMAVSEADAAEYARRDGVVVLRITRGDQPAPPPLDPHRAAYAAVTAPADPMPLRDDPPEPPPPQLDSDWTWRAPRGESHAAPREERHAAPHAAPSYATPSHGMPAGAGPSYAAPTHAGASRPPSSAAADDQFVPIDPSTLAALAASPAISEPEPPLPLFAAMPGVAAPGVLAPSAVAAPVRHAQEHDHPRLEAAATATFWFACAAYGLGGLGVATALIAGIAAVAQQGTPPAATSRAVAIVGFAVGAPATFAAVVSHAISGACLGLREIVLRRRRKRDY